MHTMWKGLVSFGLVSIPVRMFAATEDKDVHFRYLHKECRSPVRYVKRCPVCQADIGEDDIVRGYEIEPGRFVILRDEDLASVQPKKSRTIDILDFVHLSEIDPVFFDKSYYLAPDETGLKAYALLRQAMLATGKIAIARIVIRTSSSLAALRTFGDALVLETIFFPDEVRNVREIPFYGVVPAVDPREMEMAATLISQLTAVFDPNRYRDEYRQALLDRIAAAAAGEAVETPAAAPPRGNVVDLMRALEESIAAAKGSAHADAPALAPPGAGRRPRRTS